MMRQTTHAIPHELLLRLGSIFPPDIARVIERTFIERPTSFRCNTLKTSIDEVLNELKREGVTVKRLNWIREGFLVTNTSLNQIRKLPCYQEGKIYLQSLASMAPVLALDPKPGERVLDMTAAPGSKTSQIAAAMRGEGTLHACERDEIRFKKLGHNMDLLGVSAATGFLTLHRGDAARVFGEEFHGSFDKILLDAPCSAEARIVSRDRSSYGFWKEKNILERAGEQKALLDAAWPLLRSGGSLVYSTCTFAPEENEVQVSRFLSSRSDCKPSEIPAFSGVKLLPGLEQWRGERLSPGVRLCRRIVPNAEIEGFFLAKLVKR